MPFTGPVVEQTASIEIDVFVMQCYYCVLWWIVFHGKSAVGFFMCAVFRSFLSVTKPTWRQPGN